MKFLFSLSVLLGAAAAQAAQIDPALLEFSQGRAGPVTRVVVILKRSNGVLPSPRRYDYLQTVSYLKTLSGQAYADLRAYLGTQPAAPREIRILTNYWINSTITADVSPAGLRLLASAPAATKIYADRPIRNDPNRRGTRRPGLDRDVPYQFREMGLDRLMTTDPMIDGRGALLGHLDTGVDGTHPALKGKVLKYWDSRLKRYTEPVDTEEHGTHTAGSMVGGDRSTILIGVAPAAKLIASGGLQDYDDMLASMQVLLDPDGDPTTVDFPRAISNSWNCEGAPDVELFYTAVGAWEAAGILPVFSAGNAGPDPQTITHPHEHPATFAVAATGEDGIATSFSSRGPGIFHGTKTLKPDLAAPGANIRSSIPGNRYDEFSGTSMAAPQVAGTIGLLLQIDPKFTPDQLRKILIESSKGVNEDGQPIPGHVWNATYGQGKLSSYDAVQLAKRVRVRRFQRESDVFPGLLSGPQEAILDGILREESVRVSDLLDYPAEFDGFGWLTPEQIW